MRCTEVADQPFPIGECLGRDIGDRGRSLEEDLNATNANSIPAFPYAIPFGWLGYAGILVQSFFTITTCCEMANGCR